MTLRSVRKTIRGERPLGMHGTGAAWPYQARVPPLLSEAEGHANPYLLGVRHMRAEGRSTLRTEMEQQRPLVPVLQPPGFVKA